MVKLAGTRRFNNNANAMNQSPSCHGDFKCSLGFVFATLLCCGTIVAGPGPNQNVQPRSSVTTQDATKQRAVGAGPSRNTTPVPNANVDYGVFKPGATIYSSGTADVIVQVLDARLVRPLQPGPGRPKDATSPFHNGVYLLSADTPRYLGSCKDAGKTINLGKLPPGELIFGLRVNEYNCYFKTGDASRNPDNLVHANIRTFKSGGPVEIWFEDAFGLKGTDRSDRDFDDLVLQVSGGIDNGDVSGLVQAVQKQPAASREAMISELKKADPKLAEVVSTYSQKPSK